MRFENLRIGLPVYVKSGKQYVPTIIKDAEIINSVVWIACVINGDAYKCPITDVIHLGSLCSSMCSNLVTVEHLVDLPAANKSNEGATATVINSEEFNFPQDNVIATTYISANNKWVLVMNDL